MPVSLSATQMRLHSMAIWEMVLASACVCVHRLSASADGAVAESETDEYQISDDANH